MQRLILTALAAAIAIPALAAEPADLDKASQQQQAMRAQQRGDDARKADVMAKAEKTPALSILMSKGAKPKRVFTVGDDLTGWLIDFAGETDIYYTSSDGDFLLLGALIDREGSNVSARIKKALDERQAGADAPAKPSNQGQVADTNRQEPGGWKNALWQGVKDAPAVTVGDGSKDLYVFFEPTCGYCARLHHQLTDKDVTAHYLMVSFLSAESPALASTLYALPDDKIEDAVDDLVMSTLAGSSHQAWRSKYGNQKANMDVRGALSDNVQLMREAGASGTPAVVYRDSDGNVQVQKGMPQPAVLDRMLEE